MHEFILIGVYLLVLLYSIILHEVSHGVVALWLGDRTAQYAGRLTLKPMSHVDPWGSVIVPIFLLLISNFQMAFGWAKPVPYNPYNLRDQKWGPLLVALAGPGTNIIIAVIAVILAKLTLIPILMKQNIQDLMFGRDWSGIADVVAGSLGGIFYEICIMIIFWNVILAFFNLIPIPPLDGSKLLYTIFPFSQEAQILFEQYGMILLLFIIIFFSGPIQFILSNALIFFFHLAT